jgi:pimeloyl-ACP methyl ester carboxylesterase
MSLVEAAGGSANVYGISSGASLALEAVAQLGGKIKKLALYEAPYNDDPTSRQAWWDYRRELKKLISEKHNGDAVVLFMKFVGTPVEMVGGMKQSPMWPVFESVAPTLEYDAEVLGDNRNVPVERAAKVGAKTLVLDGGANLTIMPFMHASAVTLAENIPGAKRLTLEGQMHDVKAEALAPVLIEFFSE